MDPVTNAWNNISKIRDEMIEVAKKKETIFYLELFNPYGLNMKNSVHREELGKILGNISREEYESEPRRPLLSSVVIKMDTRMPSEGFLGEFGKMYPEIDGTKFCDARLKETHDYWSQQPQNKP